MEGLWVNPQKEVLYSMKARITFRCRMNFEDFPLDTQKCQFQVMLLHVPSEFNEWGYCAKLLLGWKFEFRTWR